MKSNLTKEEKNEIFEIAERIKARCIATKTNKIEMPKEYGELAKILDIKYNGKSFNKNINYLDYIATQKGLKTASLITLCFYFKLPNYKAENYESRNIDVCIDLQASTINLNQNIVKNTVMK